MLDILHDRDRSETDRACIVAEKVELAEALRTRAEAAGDAVAAARFRSAARHLTDLHTTGAHRDTDGLTGAARLAIRRLERTIAALDAAP